MLEPPQYPVKLFCSPRALKGLLSHWRKAFANTLYQPCSPRQGSGQAQLRRSMTMAVFSACDQLLNLMCLPTTTLA